MPQSPPPGQDWTRALPVAPGLCATCEYAHLTTTRRGTAYLRCTRAGWDPRLLRYPPLPVIDCVGFESRV